jgi:hypothetical protein
MPRPFYPKHFFHSTIPNQCEINGRVIQYDGCASIETRKTVQSAQEFYMPDQWEFIGIGFQIWVRGNKQSRCTYGHFFFRRRKYAGKNEIGDAIFDNTKTAKFEFYPIPWFLDLKIKKIYW